MKHAKWWIPGLLLCLLLTVLPIRAEGTQTENLPRNPESDAPVITLEKQKVEMINQPELVNADGEKDIVSPETLRSDVSYIYPGEGVVHSMWFQGTKMELPFYEYSRGAANGSNAERIYIYLTRGDTVVATYEGQFEKEAGWYTWTISIDGSENWEPGTVVLAYHSTFDRGSLDKVPLTISILEYDGVNPGNYVSVDLEIWDKHLDCGMLERILFEISSIGYGGQTFFVELSDENHDPIYQAEGPIPLKQGTTYYEMKLEKHLRPGTYYMRAFSSGQHRNVDIYCPFYVDNRGVAWHFDKESGTLTFFGSGDMPRYSTSSPWGSAYKINVRRDVHNLIVEPGITSVSADLCQFYSGLKSVSLPQGLQTIGMYAFSNCGLETIALPNSVSTIGYSAFEECTQLKRVTTFGSWQEPDPSAKGIQSNAFSSASLETIEIPAAIEKTEFYSFYDAKKLKTVKFQDEAPMFDGRTFEGAPQVTVYYPKQLDSWTEDVRRNYSGDVTWQDYELTLCKVNMTRIQAHVSGNIIYWDAVRFANLYQIYRREASETSWTLIKNTRSLAYKDESAKQGVKYYYKVRARNGNWMSSLDIPAMTAVRPYPLSSVKMTQIIGHKTGNIVYWEAVDGADLYQVFRRAESESGWTLIKNTRSLAYKDESAALGVKYYYKVRARNGEKMSSLDITALSAVRPYPLAGVKMTKAIGHGTGNIIYWEAVENAKLYQVYRRAASESGWTLLKNTGSLAYKDTEAESGVKYYYKVVARNGEERSSMDIAALSAVRP